MFPCLVGFLRVEVEGFLHFSEWILRGRVAGVEGKGLCTGQNWSKLRKQHYLLFVCVLFDFHTIFPFWCWKYLIFFVHISTLAFSKIAYLFVVRYPQFWGRSWGRKINMQYWWTVILYNICIVEINSGQSIHTVKADFV